MTVPMSNDVVQVQANRTNGAKWMTSAIVALVRFFGFRVLFFGTSGKHCGVDYGWNPPDRQGN